MFKPFDSVLIANRGEIAVRIIRATHDAGLRAVAVYADPDADAPHVRLADEAYALHGTTAADTYLDMRKILDVALASEAQSVHPGYGFLSENPQFAQAVIDAGLVWIGPRPDTIRLLGDKVTAREIADKVGAPLVPGTSAPVDDAWEIQKFADEHGMPIAIKAAHGGGGRGLRVVRDADRIAEAFDAATRESVAAFGRGECFVERYLDKPRHVEAQVIADAHGTVVVVGTRDCTLQRRHQKLVEEAPAPFLTTGQETAIRDAARAICLESGYLGAGTVEFLVGSDGTVSFLEVNTRLQVEHPVTEQTTGIDLVLEQFRIARGEPLSISHDPETIGHAFEFRINCEDPTHSFVPSPGTITEWTPPQGPGIRLDSGVEAGTVVGGQFDSLLAKLIVSGPDRATALARSRRALAEMRIEGLPTVLPFHRAVTRTPEFTVENTEFAVHTTWIEADGTALLEIAEDSTEVSPGGLAPAGDGDTVSVLIGGRAHQVRLPGLAGLGAHAETIRAQAAEIASALDPEQHSGDDVTAPMQGTVSKILVVEGQAVSAGDLIAVVEAMKMENPVRAHKDGRIEDLGVVDGDTRAGGQLICHIRSPGSAASTNS
ncbi:acetyl/propionyl/methylcrotonyl-CoA carboxylase subunit alpha [Candidatus Mycolicibacterium alkanivorans]|uniref:biotin carboxylase n=1 Tax=Candidatus Mycolicibacterium alkanivorans TaxID=2954114 RepID=A0ABS9Z0E7_9MYCO|nr:biotin carboxylase N-terminal domain-containing protein [Candidatus Mycolicibacterium alkanivorans]MCI4676504.1 ATP-grasp domain-containing protein [Candidatus Mycolicibacterium alkanivorans]